MASSKKIDPFMVDTDTAPLTDDEVKTLRPAKDVFKDLGVPMPPKPRGRPKSDNPKISTSIRLDAEVVEYFKKSGQGWQSRMNTVLRKAAGL